METHKKSVKSCKTNTTVEKNYLLQKLSAVIMSLLHPQVTDCVAALGTAGVSM